MKVYNNTFNVPNMLEVQSFLCVCVFSGNKHAVAFSALKDVSI